MGIEMDPNKVFMLPKAYPRESLGNLLPLPNPISMQIDPASLCNFKCSFCPTGDPHLIKASGRGQMFMKLDLFQKIMDDVGKFERPLKVLKLFKDGEPMLNPNFIEMVKAAKRVGKVERVETTSNGSKIAPGFSEKLVESGIDRVVLSIEGVTSERYLKFARVKFDFDAFVEKVRHLYSIRGDMKLHVKTVAQNLDYTIGEDRMFFDTFGPISDGIFIENTVASWPSFAVADAVHKDIDAYGRQTVHKEICPYLFYSLSINADGIVSPCCVDWNRELAIGDLKTDSIMDIWHGEKLRELRHAHVFGGLSSVSSCSSCGQVHACTHDNLDGHREQLKKQLS
ncbi:radical SAM/SPASM domain-containing protein [Ensifer soli]|uniref:radical SAM/SPASM domain-containing protein n=1 Tax=Ciceribacter sp. sgz301302 TaxID=3342379 RepID=UPI0035BA5499